MNAFKLQAIGSMLVCFTLAKTTTPACGEAFASAMLYAPCVFGVRHRNTNVSGKCVHNRVLVGYERACLLDKSNDDSSCNIDLDNARNYCYTLPK